MMRRFLRCTTRELLLLVLAIGVLLAIVAPWLRQGVTGRRREIATRDLLTAASASDKRAALKALAAGADVGAWDKDHTPLSFAIRDGNLPLIDILLEAGADPNQSLPGRQLTPLEYAAQLDNAAVLARLLEAGATGERALRICVESGHDQTLKLLLSNLDSAGLLTVAIQSNLPREQKLKMVRLLLEHRDGMEARGDDVSPGLEEAMDLAMRNSDAELFGLLLEFGATYTAREAAAFNRLEDVRQMVQENPQLLRERLRPYYYATPGQEPTLLGTALRFGHREMALFLVDAGAPLEALEWPSASMLHKAAIGGDPELIKLLAGRGLWVNAKDGWTDTPLHEATWRGHTTAVAALIELGAEVNAQGANQRTPLHAAAWKNQHQIARLLLAAGADTSLVDRHGKTPREVATEQGSVDVAKLLEELAPPD